MYRFRGVASVTLAAATLASLDAAAAPVPRQLYNKTIVLKWSERIHEKTPDGRMLHTRLNHEGTIYISNAGRYFVRNKRTNDRGVGGTSKTFEISPDRSLSPADGSIDFQDGKIVGIARVGGFARRVTVSFDGAISSCAVNVFYGNSGKPAPATTLDGGGTVEILAISASGAGCSLRDGNPFAN